MAKDKSGYMSQSLAQASEPVAPNFGLLEQAGAFKGKAAEIDGQTTAANIAAVGTVGKAAYEGYVSSEASKLAAHVTEGLNTPSFVGPVAAKHNEQVQQLEEARAAGRLVGEPTSELVKEWHSRAQQISEAAAGKVFSQREAQSRLATEMRELIGKHPSQASRIREVYNAYTGVSDWNTREIQGALTAKGAEDEGAKRRARLLEADAKKITDIGIASRFGMKNTEEVYRHLSEGSDDGVRMYSAMAAANLVTGANEQLTKGDMNTAYNNAIVASTARFAEVTQSVTTRLAQQGIDINNIGALTPEKESAIQKAFLEAKSAERKAMEGALTTVRDRIAREPTMDANVVNGTITMLEQRLVMPVTKDFGEMLAQLRHAATSRLQTAQTAQAAMTVVEQGMNSVWGKEMVAKMRDVRTRKQLMSDYPNNQFVQELGKQIEGGQSAYSATMDRMQRIADALLNPGGSTVNTATLVDSSKTPQGVKETADAISMIKGEGVKVLNNYEPATDLGTKSVVVSAQHFVMGDKEWPSMFRSVMGDTYKNVLKNTPERVSEFEQAFKGRSERLLTDIIPKEIKGIMARLPDNKLVVKGGVVGLANNPTTPAEVQAQIELSSILYKTNQLLVAHAKVGGTSMADTFVNIVSPTAKPTEVKTTNETTTDKGKLPPGLVDQIPGMVLSNVGRIPDTAPARPITGSAPTTEQGTPPPKAPLGVIEPSLGTIAPEQQAVMNTKAAEIRAAEGSAEEDLATIQAALKKKNIQPDAKAILKREERVLVEAVELVKSGRVLVYDRDGRRKAAQ